MSELLRDRYEPLEVVGEGGEGRLVKALDHQHERFVALKLRAVTTGTDRELVLHEARALLALPPHPNLAIVRDDFFEDGQYAIVMDWVDGVDLNRVLEMKGRPGLAPSSVLSWLAEAAEALTYLHTQDPPVIHGDVKPANLVLTRGGHVVLVDFGVSSMPGARARRLGTPGFTAPELLTEPPSRASDIYALAATAFTLLTGDPPTGIPPTWQGVEPDQADALETAIRAGLATNPARRPSTPGELVERVRAGWGSTLPTGVLTFCLSDIEGSTRLWEQDASAMARALVRHDEIIGETVEAHGGRFLKSMGEGDATVSVYRAAEQAVTATIECQQRLAAEPWPGSLELRVRMALHTGETEQRNGDYFGTTRNVGARLRALADGHQVFLSGATAALVAHAMPAGVALVELGPHRLDGLSEPIDVYALAAPGVDAPPPATVCPYQGLLPYDVEDRARFFGRTAMIDDLVTHLTDAGFVALVGSSGSGKSSILRAGLVPCFDGGTVLTPGAQPGPLPSDSSLLVVDQFEEVFTLCHDDDERRRFIDGVLAHPGPVVVGIRADFYGSCAAHPALATAVASHQLLLGPMAEDELRVAIVEPARTTGLRVDPALVDLLVTEVANEPGALPLLSHSLRATWAARDGRTLTIEAYRSTGGVRAAIATTADQVLDALDAHQQVLARRILLRLVEPGQNLEDTRRRAALTEFAGSDDHEVAAILDRLAAARLVTVDAGSAQLAHEALIREWPTLRQWLDEDRAALRMHRHLTSAADAWLASGRDPSELYRGQRLAAATEWRVAGAALSRIEADFLDASVDEQDRALRDQVRVNRRLRTLLGAVALVLVVALVAGGVAFVQRRRAGDARDRADVARVAAVSRSVGDRQADLGMLLAAAAYRLDPTSDTRSTLLAALTAHPLLLGVLHGVDSGLEAAAFSPDGAVLATPTSDGTGTILWDTRTRRRLGTLRTNKGDVRLGAAFSPDGRMLAVPVALGAEQDKPGIEIWDVSERTLARFLPSPSGSLSSVTWNTDGSTLIAQGGVTIDNPEPPTTAVVWDTGTWTPRAPWELFEDYVDDRVLAVSGDGRRVALPFPDDTVQVWEVSTHAPVGTPIDPSAVLGRDVGEVTAIALAGDGTHLAIGTSAGSVVLVDADQRASSTVLDLSADFATSIEFSVDGTLVAVGRSDGRTELFDRATSTSIATPLAANAAAINDVSFSADGSLLATAGLDRTGALWSLDGRRNIGVPLTGQEGLIAEAVYTSDGRLLTAAADGSIAVRDGSTGRIRRRLELEGEALTVAADPSRPRVAAGGTGPTVEIWNRETGTPGPTIPLDDAWVHSVAYRPDGRLLAIAVDRTKGEFDSAAPGTGLVRFVDPETGRDRGAPLSFDASPISVAWSPDGRNVAVATDNNLVRVYDARARRRVAPTIENADAPVLDVAFTPDGARVLGATASGVTRQWDARTGREVSPELVGPPAAVAGVAYDAATHRVAATTLGLSTTRLWEMPGGQALGGELVGGSVPSTLRTVDLPHFARSRAAFSPDGTHLATPGGDGASVLWDLRPVAWLRAACATAGRDLTAAEWREHLPDRNRVSVCPTQ